MAQAGDEEKLLRPVAGQNANSLPTARQRPKRELIKAKEALQIKTGELTQSLSLLRATIEAATDGILVTNSDGMVTEFNKKYVQMWGLSERLVEAANHTLLLKTIASQLKDPLRFLARIEEIYADALDDTFDVMELTDGRMVERFTKIQSVNQRNVGRVWNFRDVTAQHQVGDALKKSENLRSAILDASLDAIVTMDHEGKIVDFNPAAENTFGYRSHYAVGRVFSELLIPERLRQKHREELAHYVAVGASGMLGQRMEWTVLHADGHEFISELSISLIPESEPPMFTSTLRDITNVNAALAVQGRLAAIVESSEDGIVGKTLNGIVTSWNKSAERIFGHRAEEIIGQSILKIIPPERHSEEDFILDRLRHGLRVEHYESERLTRDGRLISVSLSSSPVLDAHGNVIGASKIVRDITERKRAEQILRQTEAELHALAAQTAVEREQLLDSERSARAEAERMSAMKDQFLATLSHELRTPLSAILGWSQVLRRGVKTEADLVKGLDVIERNARVQTQLIEDLLDMSRITAGKVRLDIQPVDPISFIEAAIETVRPAADVKGIRIEKLLDSAAGPVSGDPSRLQQVVWNLLSNAIKFTPKGGKVQVMLERVNSHIEISVADTGVGIKPEFLMHVFERFRQADASTTRKYGGLGIGLAIVKHLVELHGGSVRVTSQGDDQGANFAVQLPVTVVHRHTHDESRVHPRVDSVLPPSYMTMNLNGVKVLVVDDEADACELIKRVLADCHAQVFTASTAGDALLLVEREKPHVLVSDIGMPEVDGFELLKRVRALGKDRGGRLPAIALTAFARSEDRTRALHAGFQVHVAKPVDPSELIATVASVAGRTGRTSLEE